MDITLVSAYTNMLRTAGQSAQPEISTSHSNQYLAPTIPPAAEVGKVDQKILESVARTRADVTKTVEQLSTAQALTAESPGKPGAMYTSAGAVSMGVQTVGFFISTHA